MNDKIHTECKAVDPHFGHHVILYAKGWYERSDNILNDLQSLLELYAGTKVSQLDVKDILCQTFSEYCPSTERARAINEMLGWSYHHELNIKRTPEQIMIGLISICDGKYCDPTQCLPEFTTDSTKRKIEAIKTGKDWTKVS